MEKMASENEFRGCLLEGCPTAENENFSNHRDCGEIWFGENVMCRILRWFQQTDFGKDRKATRIIDLGCGNGIFLQELSEAGYQMLTGVDYSAAAIQLATRIISMKRQCASIEFQVADILNVPDSACTIFNKEYHICTDKGTYDAISLDPDGALDKRKRYIQNVSRLLLTDGLLLLTSCNWTKEELMDQFKGAFRIMDEIPMPQFTFGGKTGQKVTSLVLQKTQISTD